jgi:L,D-transpeptidase YcbB
LFFFAIVKRITLILIVAVMAGCSHLKEPASNRTGLAAVLRVDTALIHAAHLTMPLSVESIYTEKNFFLLWHDSTGFNDRGDTLFYFIRHADRFGLIPDDYHLDELVELMRDSSDQGKIRIDMYLTDSYFSMRHHLKYGRLDSKTFARIDLKGKTDSAGHVFLLNDIRGLTPEFNRLQPAHVSYQLIRDSLQRLLSSDITDSIWINRIEQMKLNMERWRWTANFPSRYLRVNIPSFMMEVVENDSVYLTSNVIVGKRENATPLIQSVITSFTIYPYWHVPRSIAIKELLPSIQKDSAYLNKHNYDVLDRYGKVVDASMIDWLSLHEDNFPYVLRQRDGRENTLGVIKFEFNNPFNVYLHDTNGRRLFSRTMRALSHGCVRVQKAAELARYLVKDDSIYITPDDLDQYLSLQQRYKIKVVKPIPLFIQYFTCEPKKGRLLFYTDVYKKDSLMNASLNPVILPVLPEQISGL